MGFSSADKTDASATARGPEPTERSSSAAEFRSSVPISSAPIRSTCVIGDELAASMASRIHSNSTPGSTTGAAGKANPRGVGNLGPPGRSGNADATATASARASPASQLPSTKISPRARTRAARPPKVISRALTRTAVPAAPSAKTASSALTSSWSANAPARVGRAWPRPRPRTAWTCPGGLDGSRRRGAVDASSGTNFAALWLVAPAPRGHHYIRKTTTTRREAQRRARTADRPSARARAALLSCRGRRAARAAQACSSRGLETLPTRAFIKTAPRGRELAVVE